MGSAGRGAARASGRILTGAIGSFLGVSTAQRAVQREQDEPETTTVRQRAEASANYQPILNDDYAVPQEARPWVADGQPAALASRPVRIDSPSVTVVHGRERREDFGPDEIYTPAARSRAETHATSGVSNRGGVSGSSGRFESGGADDETPEASRLETARTGVIPTNAVAASVPIAVGNAKTTSRTTSRHTSADSQDDALLFGTAARERPIPTERREAASSRDRLHAELETQSSADVDELSEVFRPAPSPERTRT
jgi:hypothetical protein